MMRQCLRLAEAGVEPHVRLAYNSCVIVWLKTCVWCEKELSDGEILNYVEPTM